MCVFSLEMMLEIVPSSDLFVMQVEMDLYTLAKKVCREREKELLCMYALLIV